jgi:chromosome segregation ATPase
METFRAIVRGKDEALTRGRALYQAVDQEAQQLRAVASGMRLQLEALAAESQQSGAAQEQVQALKDMLEKDTIRAEEAEKRMDELVVRLASTESQRRELEARLRELKDQNEDLRTQVDLERQERQRVVEELNGSNEALVRATEHISAAASSKDDSNDEVEAAREQAEHASQEVERLGAILASAQRDLEAAQADAKLSRAQKETAEERFQDINLRLAAAETVSGDSQVSSDSLKRQLAQLESQTWAAEARATLLDGQIRETQEAAQAQVAAAEERAMAAQREVERQQSDLAQVRAELAAAFAKLTEYDLERQRVRQAPHERKALVGELHISERPTKENPAINPVAEMEKLKAENAAMKKKLVMAENAIETAALLKSKVARLEAQLKGTKK